MNSTPEATSSPRKYRQSARAKAAAKTARDIVASFIKRLNEQWFEEITLDSIAQDSGVTVQTVIRRFSSKAGLLEAAMKQLGDEISVRRPTHPSDIDRTIDALSADYEAIGDLILRFLAQEVRHDALKPIVDQGRKGHRTWLAEVFVKELSSLSPAKKRKRLDAIVVATDLYVWKLVRRDMGRSIKDFKAISKSMVTAALSVGD